MKGVQRGFTLIELMIVVVIVAIFAAIAIPSYQAYTRKAIAAKAQQEIQLLAEQLERHKGKNFSYLKFDPSYMYQDVSSTVVGYDATKAMLPLPLDANGSGIQYLIYLRDGSDPTRLLSNNSALGQQWVILAEANSKVNMGSGCTNCNSVQEQNYSFLLTSKGLRCKTKGKLVVSDTLTVANMNAAKPCGANSEDW